MSVFKKFINVNQFKVEFKKEIIPFLYRLLVQCPRQPLILNPFLFLYVTLLESK
jgi:hypothetical protein